MPKAMRTSGRCDFMVVRLIDSMEFRPSGAALQGKWYALKNRAQPRARWSMDPRPNRLTPAVAVA
jgi:hypothetical protein